MKAQNQEKTKEPIKSPNIIICKKHQNAGLSARNDIRKGFSARTLYSDGRRVQLQRPTNGTALAVNGV